MEFAENPQKSKHNSKTLMKMKKSIFALLVVALSATLCSAQEKKVSFTKSDQAEIQKILGKDFTAVLGDQGQLAIVAPKSVSGIKSTARGGFTKLPGSAANATLAAYEKAWVYKQSSLSMFESKLGAERVKQLESVMAKKGLSMR